jgi:type IV pilus assembly protein PilA
VKKLNTRRGGFTLIELMIVVAIIGILAAIAIPNFLRFQLKAKSSEGKTNLAAIRTAEESYFAEYGSYVSSEASPPTINYNTKITFSHATSGIGFDELGWAPEGQVYFNYTAGINAPTGDRFTASAAADIDNDTTPQHWGYTTNKAVATHPHGASLGQCDPNNLNLKVVGRCDTVSGQSVF